MTRKIALLTGIVLPSLLFSAANAQQIPIPLDKAREVFDQARSLSQADAGHLWGLPLYGPMMLVDPGTRFVVANQPDQEHRLAETRGLYVGKLGEKDSVANTAYQWGGLTWTMLMWPLPVDRYSRGRLLMHESFHRLQEPLGLPASNPTNNHLDTQEGRAWLRLEWRALAEALIHRNESRRTAIREALIFRAYRRSLFGQAAEQERALELNEGLAEYTGYKLCGWPDEILADRAAVRLEQDERGTNFIRSFAYSSGPAWALLLDQAEPAWRKKLNRKADLSDLLAGALKLTVPADLQAESNELAARYDGATVIAEEAERAKVRQQAIARHRARFSDGPVLILPLDGSLSYTFDPRTAEALGDLGTVYLSARIAEGWGILEATKGVLMSRDPSGKMAEARVPAPETTAGRSLTGDGWTLSLAERWKVVPGARSGDFTLAKEE